MKIKFCGFKEEGSIKAAVKSKVDFIGFVFHENSPRNVSYKTAEKLKDLIPASIKKVAVIVDAPFDKIKLIEKNLKPDFFQLHGSESVNYIKKLKDKFPKIGIIKSFKVTSLQDLEKSNEYQNYVDYFLFDNKEAGSGQKFDWSLFKEFTPQKQWFLSGGIKSCNLQEAIKATKANMVDISSGIELEKGIKSEKLIENFMSQSNLTQNKNI